uniref:LPS export ABC transporter permease LptG n=1 Tax=uncultured Thiotrichaceae bacterium TaxID=298394 RepID=A0A6S6UFV6_9GAMM|nr:MAG: LPS export ABC transporter permease LptG [uncultured Thiotrichaceae bacterium]
MKLLERYLWKNILVSILVTWLSLTLLFGLFDFLSELGDTKQGTRYGTFQALLYVAYTFPRTLYTNFPYAVLIGSLMGLGNMASGSEITAMRAAGYSIRNIVITTLKLGFVLALMAFALGEWVAPKSEAYAQNFKVRMLQKQVAVSSNGVWLKNGDQYLAIEKIWSEKKLEGLSIYEVDIDQGGFSRILKAKSATNDGTEWQLHEVTERLLNINKVDVKYHALLEAGDLLPDNMLALAQVNPEQLTALELARFIEHQSENSLSTERFELEYWKHFTTPLSTLVMLILAAPLVFGFQRNAGAGQRIFIGILIGIAYLLLDKIISRTGLVYGLSPLLSAAAPLLLFSLAGLFMLNRIR